MGNLSHFMGSIYNQTWSGSSLGLGLGMGLEPALFWQTHGCGSEFMKNLKLPFEC